MPLLQCRALEQELEFHRSVYDLQVGYVESLLQAMRYVTRRGMHYDSGKHVV